MLNLKSKKKFFLFPETEKNEKIKLLKLEIELNYKIIELLNYSIIFFDNYYIQFIIEFSHYFLNYWIV